MGAMAEGGMVMGSASAAALSERLRHACEAVSARAKEAACASFEQPVRRLHQAAQRVGMAWCGSWLPGMANLYGQLLQPHAAPARRAAERSVDRDGDDDHDDNGVTGSGRIGWLEWTPEAIRDAIHQAAGQPDVQQLLSHAARAAIAFETSKASSLATLAAALHSRAGDLVLRDLQRDVQQLQMSDHDALLGSWRPATRLLRVRGGGSVGASESLDWAVPAHLSELAAIEAVRSPVACLLALAGLMRRAAEHGKALLQAERAEFAAKALRQPDFVDSAPAPLLHHLLGEGARQRRVAGAHAR